MAVRNGESKSAPIRASGTSHCATLDETNRTLTIARRPIMIVVIFEVWPEPDRRQDYLDLAASLRAELSVVDGFVSVERFASLIEDGKILSLSVWRDEESVRRWRNIEAHRAAQAIGRESLFRRYRIRVAQVLRDYSLEEREQAPTD